MEKIYISLNHIYLFCTNIHFCFYCFSVSLLCCSSISDLFDLIKWKNTSWLVANFTADVLLYFFPSSSCNDRTKIFSHIKKKMEGYFNIKQLRNSEFSYFWVIVSVSLCDTAAETEGQCWSFPKSRFYCGKIRLKQHIIHNFLAPQTEFLASSFSSIFIFNTLSFCCQNQTSPSVILLHNALDATLVQVVCLFHLNNLWFCKKQKENYFEGGKNRKIF